MGLSCTPWPPPCLLPQRRDRKDEIPVSRQLSLSLNMVNNGGVTPSMLGSTGHHAVAARWDQSVSHVHTAKAERGDAQGKELSPGLVWCSALRSTAPGFWVLPQAHRLEHFLSKDTEAQKGETCPEAAVGLGPRGNSWGGCGPEEFCTKDTGGEGSCSREEVENLTARKSPLQRSLSCCEQLELVFQQRMPVRACCLEAASPSQSARPSILPSALRASSCRNRCNKPPAPVTQDQFAWHPVLIPMKFVRAQNYFICAGYVLGIFVS